jgi:4-hydroxy-3-methylbut-2-enyl diphosphate reductase
MEVRTADHLGMCFGVRDAIDMALGLARQGPVTVLGDLVHNPDVIAQLETAGAVRARKQAEVATPTVLLTAHGTSNRVRLRLQQEGFQVHDAVCPLVQRVHLALRKLMAEGRHPVVIGQAGHVEVRGLVGDLEEYTIVLHEEDIESLAGYPRVGIVAQTTQPLHRVLALVAAIRRRFPQANVHFIDTVCQPTKDRQEALHRLAAQTEAIVVVGGPESNNSRKLTELARRLGRKAYQVAGAAELRPEWFDGVQVVGLTAGTSTPDHIIAEVRARLESLA